MPAAPEHPAVEAWTPQAPPPPQRRIGPGLVASLIALLLVFGMVGLVAARQAGVARSGAGSPEAAASGLLAALDRDSLDAQALDRAARYLTGEERLLVSTEAGRIARLAANPPAGQDALGIVGLGARDVRFQRVGGSDGVVVLEALSGTVRLRSSGGGTLELSLDEARRRLAQQTNSRVTSLRVVTLRAGGRWYVALLPTMLEWSRLAVAGGPADYAKLTAAARPGAASPEAAVGALLQRLRRPLADIVATVAPSERNAFDAFFPALKGSQGWPAGPDGRFGLPQAGTARVGPVTRTERVADGIVRVHFDYRPRLGGPGMPVEPPVPAPSVIAVQRNGTWYPSMVFTLVDATLTSAEREQHS